MRHYPVVTITGPRQAGKTTLAKMAFPNMTYVNLEAPDEREFASRDPQGFLAQLPQGAILDEIQRLPQLLSYIQVMVDRLGRNGLFVLTGSHQFELQAAIVQSLAGRTALLTLYPLSIAELKSFGTSFETDEYLFHGFLPRIHANNQDPVKAYRNYFQTYVERDLRQIIQVKDLSTFESFLKLCAGRIGQLFNASSLASEVGVSYHTIEKWISVLEASFILTRLFPYFENFNKRIIKSPKIYFTEIGLATYLLGIEDLKQLSRDPLRGNLFENLVVIELMKSRLNRGLDPNLYFFREHNRNEIDVIYKSANALIPIEIKSSMTFNPDFMRSLHRFKSWVGDRMSTGYLVYAGKHQQAIGDLQVVNYKNLADLL